MTELIRTEQLSYSYPVRGVVLDSVDCPGLRVLTAKHRSSAPQPRVKRARQG